MNSFDSLLAPLTADQFFHEYQDKKYLHVKGVADKFAGLMNWQELNRLLNQTSIWSSDNLKLVADGQQLDSAQFCENAINRDDKECSQPVAEKVQALLQGGASLVADHIDALSDAISSVANTLENALHAKVQCNLYCSVEQRRALDSHFDTHDVYALHCEGEKVWRLYEGRIEKPINHVAFKSFTKQQHHQQRGKVIDEITMQPGDLLYIPRGQYHDALASSGSTLHVTFGATHVLGIDVLDAFKEIAFHDPLFRGRLPAPDTGNTALKQYVNQLTQRLLQVSNQDTFIDELATYQMQYRYKRGGYKLPVAENNVSYKRASGKISVSQTANGKELSWPGGVATIPVEREAAIIWAVERETFSRSEFLEQLPGLTMTTADGLLNDLIRMGLLIEE